MENSKNINSSTRKDEILSLVLDLDLPKPKNYTICYLRWLNKILKPFYDYSKDTLSVDELACYFTSPNTTNFKCYLRLALDFEMIELNGDFYTITQNGKCYISNFNLLVFNSSPNQLPSINLTNDQKRLLLKILTIGNLTVHKVDIYWFLKFSKETNGKWIPNKKDFEQNKLEFANEFFGVSYKKRTMYEFLNFSCNFRIELGFFERIKLNTDYDQVKSFITLI